MKTITLAILTLALIALTGCNSLIPSSRRAESVYQLVNALDFAQTVHLAREPLCFDERDPVTRAVIGRHPTERSVKAFGIAQGALHLAVSSWLDREVDATGSTAWRRTRTAWHVLTVGLAGRNVVRNHRLGLKPFGSGCRFRHPVIE